MRRAAKGNAPMEDGGDEEDDAAMDDAMRDFTEARAALDTIRGHGALDGVPLLVLANKQDRAGALDASQVAETLRLGEESSPLLRQGEVLGYEAVDVWPEGIPFPGLAAGAKLG